MSGEQTPHSAAYIRPERELWWNRDWLELMARRLGLSDVRRALHVGCGAGHWGRLLCAVLPAQAQLTGVDPEERWLEQARHEASAAGLEDRLSYRAATAEELPFADGTFDLVTCQTVLIHVADLDRAVREMVRVLRPGGLLLAAEPNNRVGFVVQTPPALDESAEALSRRLRFYLVCEQGKVALGRGHNSAGDLVAGALARAGQREARAYLSDRTWALVPPYEDEEQRTFARLLCEPADQGTWNGQTREETRELFLAGGGGEAEVCGRRPA